ncbi:MAG TPA: DUF1134 domain-containing protein [Allosphingosinicella sp.]|uniref:DUF1134 domain-containing protein n=1 Tax=Allosphingosinicella sp. TaxID=2823234 RepID=UPI002ED8AFC1
MLYRSLMKMVAVAGFALAAPASAQSVDPNDRGEYEPAASAPNMPAAPAPEQPLPTTVVTEPAPTEEYAPIEPAQNTASGVQQVAPVQPTASGSAEARASAAVSNTVAKDNVLSAAEGVFGRGAEGLAGIIENILKKQGEPTAYITGSEAGGAVAVGLRYGKGMLHHKVEGDRKVYWTGPSIGFDFGGDANKVFVLVYNVSKADDLFTRFGAAEGNAYVVGGFKASYLRKGDKVLIPIRTGMGMRLGVNAGYMKFTPKGTWIPF